MIVTRRDSCMYVGIQNSNHLVSGHVKLETSYNRNI